MVYALVRDRVEVCLQPDRPVERAWRAMEHLCQLMELRLSHLSGESSANTDRSASVHEVILCCPGLDGSRGQDWLAQGRAAQMDEALSQHPCVKGITAAPAAR